MRCQIKLAVDDVSIAVNKFANETKTI